MIDIDEMVDEANELHDRFLACCEGIDEKTCVSAVIFLAAKMGASRGHGALTLIIDTIRKTGENMIREIEGKPAMTTPQDLADRLEKAHKSMQEGYPSVTCKRKDSLSGFAQEIEGLALDELNDLRVALGREHHTHVEAANLARKKLDTIKNVMFVRKNGGQIGITDHAVLRYMERHKGVDVRAIREEINAIAQHRKLIEGTEGHYEANGVTIVLPQGAVIATILPRAEPPAQPDPARVPLRSTLAQEASEEAEIKDNGK